MDGMTAAAALGPGSIDAPVRGRSAQRSGTLLNPALDPTLFAGILQIAAFDAAPSVPAEPRSEPPQRSDTRRAEEDDGASHSEDSSADAARPSDTPPTAEPLVEVVLGNGTIQSQQLVLPEPGEGASEATDAEETATAVPASEELRKAAKSTGAELTAAPKNAADPQLSPESDAPLATADSLALQTEGEPTGEEPGNGPPADETLQRVRAERGAEKETATKLETVNGDAAPGDEQQVAREDAAEGIEAEEQPAAEAESREPRRSGRRGSGDDRHVDGRRAAAAETSENASATSGASAGPNAPQPRTAPADQSARETLGPPAAELPTPADVQPANLRAAQPPVAATATTSSSLPSSGAKVTANPGGGESTAAGLQRTEPSGGTAASGASGKNSKGDPGVSTVDRARLVMRVARAFQRLDGTGGTVRLRLHPAELGSVRVEVTLNKRHMRARLVTETENARSILAENLPALKTRLAEQGIHVESVAVEVDSGDLGSSQNSAEEDRRQSQEEQARSAAPWRRNRAADRQPDPQAPTRSQPVSWRRQPASGIDIRL